MLQAPDTAGRARLARYLEQHQIPATLIVAAQETPTVPLAAEALGCAVAQIVKSVLFSCKTEPPTAVLVITNGVAQVDFHKLAALLGISRKRVRLASADTVLQATGYPAGGVPPFGFDQPIPTYVDAHVLALDVVYSGGGDHQTMLRIASRDLLRATRGRVVDVRSASPGDDDGML